MKRILWLLAFLALAAPVQAADNVAVTPGSGKTMGCLDISTVCYSKLIIYDTTGAALFASGNAGYVRDTTLENAFANGTAHVIVDSTVGISLGSTYSAQTFSGIMGLASTNAPTATAGDLWPLSISPASGGVRIDLKDTPTNTNAFKVSAASGTMVDLGSQADAAWTTGSGSLIALAKTIATNSGSAIPAGTNPIGYLSAFSYAHISTATTTTVKSGAGAVHTITVNNLGTVASTTTVYDNTAGSGTVIAAINTLAGQTSYVYDVAFATGLTIVTTGTVAPDLTISYR